MSPFLFSLVKDKYQKIKKFFSFSLSHLFSKQLDAEQLEKLEELLYMQDLGGALVEELLGEIQ